MVFFFIEKNSKRAQAAEKLKDIYHDKKNCIHVIQGDCNEIIKERIIPEFPYTSGKRALVFLDPYGLQVQWSTVASLGDARTFDVFVNFPVGGIARLLPEDSKPRDSHSRLLDSVFGGREWQLEAYKPLKEVQLSLLGEPQTDARAKNIAVNLNRLYLTKMRKHFKHISKVILMRNSIHSPLYTLFLASHNNTAVDRINAIFSKSGEEILDIEV